MLDLWIGCFAALTRRAIGEGDVVDGVDPEHMARLLVSMYLGLRQTSNLDEPESFIRDLESLWMLILPGFAIPRSSVTSPASSGAGPHSPSRTPSLCAPTIYDPVGGQLRLYG